MRARTKITRSCCRDVAGYPRRRFIRRVANPSLPVVASGGVGRLDDLVDGIRDGHASAVAAASIFHFTDQSVIKARAYMRQAGLEMRVA